MFRLSRRSYARLTGVDSRLIYLAEQAIKITPVDFGIAFLGGRRTAEEQNELFRDGFSQKDGYTNLSKHQSGQAFDILPFVNGVPKLDEVYYGMAVSAILITAKELDLAIQAGALWTNFKDLPHIELL